MKQIPIIQPIHPIRLISLIGLSLLPFCSFAEPAAPVPDPVAVKPFLDVPMQSPSICRTPEGVFYLTGTVGVPEMDRSDRSDQTDRYDFQNNDGIGLWKSSDLKNWEPLGAVWSIKKDAAKDSWQRRKRPLSEAACAQGGQRLVRGMTSPKIQRINDAYYISYSMNGWGCGLLKSVTGRAEGPYKDLGQVTPEGKSLSLFEDDDSTVYMAMDEGWIARMKDDLSGPAEQPRLVMPRSGSDLGNAPFSVGRAGAFLFKRKSIYYLASAEWSSRTGRPVYDTYVAASESIYGPYDCRHLLCAHGGESAVFEGPDGQWFATMSGDDINAKFRHRPAIVPLQWGKKDTYFTRGIKYEFPAKPSQVITERGPWEKCRPLTDDIIRDVHAILAPDGYVYYTGSCLSDNYQNKVVLWRFKAEDIAKVASGEIRAESRAVMDFRDIHWLDFENRMKYGKGKWGYGLIVNCMDADIFFLDGRFYMTFNLYNITDGLRKNPTLDGGKTFTAGSGVILSKTAQWDGEWESVGRAPYSHCKLKEDDRGRIVTERYWKGIAALQADGSFEIIAKPDDLPPIQYPPQGMAYCDDGDGYGGVNFDPEFNAWRWTGTEWNGPASLHIETRANGGTYDMTFSFSESGKPEGPYPRCRNSIPHGGGAEVLRDHRGRYWKLLFGNNDTALWFQRMGLIPLDVRKEGNQYIVDIADEWPED